MINNKIFNLVYTDDYKHIKGTPLYRIIYEKLKKSIVEGAIPNSTKLPSSRELAKKLKISRSTVIKVYDLLIFERFIVAKKGSGHVVCYKQEKIVTKNVKKSKYPKISKRAKLFINNSYLTTDNFSKNNIAFRPGLPPLDIFPIDSWKKLTNNYWRNATPTNLSYAPALGLEALRINIANYLKIYRNISCNYHQIFIVSGSLNSLYLIGNSLINRNDNIVMENPTFPRAYNLFKSLKANIVPCDLDEKGVNIDTIKNNKAKLIYTTPSNQYPLGIKMSKERRIELLAWASKNNSLIIEDDYDHEFSNWEKPIPAIHSLDSENRVIYLGTFNKLLHPSLRIGYMIVPQYLISPIKSIYEQSSRFISVDNQSVLNEFITKGFLNKHIKKVIEISNERRKLFIHQTKKSFNFSKKSSGLHVIGTFKKEVDDFTAYKTLLNQNVVAYPLSNYYIGDNRNKGLVMGFSSVNNKVMKEKTNVINQFFSI